MLASLDSQQQNKHTRIYLLIINRYMYNYKKVACSFHQMRYTQPFCKIELTILRKNAENSKNICIYKKKAVLLHRI